MGRLPKFAPTVASPVQQGEPIQSKPLSEPSTSAGLSKENMVLSTKSAEREMENGSNSLMMQKAISSGAKLAGSPSDQSKEAQTNSGSFLTKRPPQLDLNGNSAAASGASPLKKILPELGPGSAQKSPGMKMQASPEMRQVRGLSKIDVEDGFDFGDDDLEELIQQDAKKKEAQHQAAVSRSSSQQALAVTPVAHLGFSSEDLVQQLSGRVEEKYYFTKPELGRGNFGVVYKAVHKITRVVRAIKRIRKNPQPLKSFDSVLKDVDVLKKLDHPNIIKVYECYQDDTSYYIVTDLCSGGELFQKILQEKHFTERRAADLFKQMLSAINYCHAKNLVHCDLKPENILFESANAIGDNSNLIKIIDFGNSTFFNPKDKLTSKFGSAYYVAPEVLRGSYTEKCDVWSLGVILYVMLCGKPPFNGPNEHAILSKIMEGKFVMDGPDWTGVSSQAKDLISKMLIYDYTKRPSAQECLKHTWFSCFQQAGEDEAKISSQIGRRSLRNLKGFRAESELQEAILYFVTNQLASKEEREDLMNTFLALDKDNDGKLTKQDLVQAYVQMGDDPVLVEQMVSEIILKVDKQEKGFIDYSEFVTTALSKRRLMTEDRLQAAFLLFGGESQGIIKLEHFKSVLGKGAFAAVDEALWMSLISDIANESGEITFANFKSMMQTFANNEQITQSLAL